MAEVSLIDANCTIQVQNQVIFPDVFGSFGNIILELFDRGLAYSVEEVKQEMIDSRHPDSVADWAQRAPAKFFLSATEASVAAMKRVEHTVIEMSWENQHTGEPTRYIPKAVFDFSDSADLVLVGTALANGWTVVTQEKFEYKRKKVQIPVVCNKLDIRWMSLRDFLTKLGVTIDLRLRDS